jgi:RNA polymerase-binding transcription factor DksA
MALATSRSETGHPLVRTAVCGQREEGMRNYRIKCAQCGHEIEVKRKDYRIEQWLSDWSTKFKCSSCGGRGYVKETSRTKAIRSKQTRTKAIRSKRTRIAASEFEKARRSKPSPKWDSSRSGPGFCRRCGGGIERGRLEVLPDTKVCSRCN